MNTAGSILRKTRLQKKLTLDAVEDATKIRQKFLEAIESDEYSKLPSLSYAKGFVKNYSDFLGLDSSNVLAFFRRQNAEISRSSLLPKGVSEPLNGSVFHLTPSRFMTLFVGCLIILFLGYFGVQYRKIQTPPKLIISDPVRDVTTVQKRINIIGETDADATASINGISALVRSDGKFFDSVTLQTGTNVITVTATSRFGKTTTILRTIELTDQSIDKQ